MLIMSTVGWKIQYRGRKKKKKTLTSSRLAPSRHKDQRHQVCDSFKIKYIHLSERPRLKSLIFFFNILDKSVRTFPLAFNRQLFENSYLTIWCSFRTYFGTTISELLLLMWRWIEKACMETSGSFKLSWLWLLGPNWARLTLLWHPSLGLIFPTFYLCCNLFITDKTKKMCQIWKSFLAITL